MDDIQRRIEGLSPGGRALIREMRQLEKEAADGVPPDEDDIAADMLPRMEKLFQEHPEDHEKFIAIVEATMDQRRATINRAQADIAKYEGMLEIISRAQELDRSAGRPTNEQMTLAEAVSKLESAGELDPLERKYFDSVKDEVIYVRPRDEE